MAILLGSESVQSTFKGGRFVLRAAFLYLQPRRFGYFSQENIFYQMLFL